MSDRLTASQATTEQDFKTRTLIAIAWCLAWGEGFKPQHPEVIEQMQKALQSKQPLPESAQPFLAQAQQLNELEFPKSQTKLEELVRDNSTLWSARIGLVYGGATKIKQYVFESASLSDIRGASALLDRINLADIPGFFGHQEGSVTVANWLDEHFPAEANLPSLKSALIPELLIYFKGGSVLAFCPAAYVNQLCDAIEKRYAYETLTANSCAVGDTFKLLEIRFGLLKDPISNTLWLDSIHNHRDNPAVQAYFDITNDSSSEAIKTAFQNRKSFNELVGKLATHFNQRRSGFNAESDRPSRCYPPMFETHPYLVRDDSDRRSAVVKVSADQIPGEPTFSEPLARKHRVGQITKREDSNGRWYTENFSWQFNEFDSWVFKFVTTLSKAENRELARCYYNNLPNNVHPLSVEEARSLREIATADQQGFVGYIYADGNNMGQYIRDQIKTPEAYEQFSNDIFEATEKSVYYAIAQHLKPYHYTPDSRSNRTNKDKVWIHPFEIVTIGGDDVLLIVPANKALAIAKTIGDRFEEILVAKRRYAIQNTSQRSPLAPLQKGGGDSRGDQIHRYNPEAAPPSQSCLSISSGVLITAVDTPIYYADKLVSQLLKSAKKKAKDLRGKGYYGGTVDFLTMKAVTMISSNITSFRDEGLTVRFPERQQDLKLHAAPYTLHELGGLIDTVKTIKKSSFPRSQLYQIRGLLQRGKRTSILNYRYFRVRLNAQDQTLLKQQFEDAWCQPLDEQNPGNLAPWMTVQRKDSDSDKTIYETPWREFVELLPFIEEEQSTPTPSDQTSQGATL